MHIFYFLIQYGINLRYCITARLCTVRSIEGADTYTRRLHTSDAEMMRYIIYMRYEYEYEIKIYNIRVIYSSASATQKCVPV